MRFLAIRVTLALRLPPLSIAVCMIICMRPDKQMPRVNARRVVARMTHQFSLRRPLSVFNEVGDVRRSDSATVQAQATVSVSVCLLERPTIIRSSLARILPEAFFKRHVACWVFGN